MTSAIDLLKKEAAKAAVDLIENGMVVGLGSGSTASIAIEELAKRVAGGLKIVAIATSQQSHMLAQQRGIQLTTFAEHSKIDITIDGADQVEKQSLNLIKGLGNALLREKIVALASKKLVIVVDASKLVDCLGDKTFLPVEIIPFGWELTRLAVSKYCPIVNLKLAAHGEPIITDSGNYLLNCQISMIEDANRLDKELKVITGVVETGLFVNMTNLVIVAKQDGIVKLQKSQ